MREPAGAQGGGTCARQLISLSPAAIALSPRVSSHKNLNTSSACARAPILHHTARAQTQSPQRKAHGKGILIVLPVVLRPVTARKDPTSDQRRNSTINAVRLSAAERRATQQRRLSRRLSSRY